MQQDETQEGSSPLSPVRAQALELRGLEFEMVVTAQAGATGAAGWRLDALAGLEGVLRAFVTDAAWIVDADVTLPVQRGRIDFDAVTVEHVGPNSAMGVSRGGLYVDVPNLGRRYLFVFTAAQVPGADFERRAQPGRGRVEDRGALDLAGLLQGVLEGGMPGQPADPQVVEMLDRTRLAGELQLGDGVLSGAGLQVVFSGKSVGRNRIGLSAPVLGQGLVLRLPQLQASSCSVTLDGVQAQTGAASADCELSVEPLRGEPARLRLRLKVERATVQGLRLSLARSAAPAPA